MPDDDSPRFGPGPAHFGIEPDGRGGWYRSMRGAWLLTAHVVFANDTFVIDHLRFDPINPGMPREGLTSADLRAVKIGDLQREARYWLLNAAATAEVTEQMAPGLHDPQRLAALRRGARLAQTKPRRGRIGYEDTHFRRVALDYLQMYAKTGGRGINGRLAAMYSEKHPETWKGLAPETVRDWVATARRKGYLTKAVPGRGGAEPGPNLFPREEQP